MAGVPTASDDGPPYWLTAGGNGPPPSTRTTASVANRWRACGPSAGPRRRTCARRTGRPGPGPARSPVSLRERRGGDEPHGEHDHAEVDDHAAVGPADQAAPRTPAPCRWLVRTDSTSDRAADAAANAPSPNASSGVEPAHAADHAADDDEHAEPRRHGEAVPQDARVDLAPAQRGGDRHQEQQGQADRHGDRVEVRRADRDLLVLAAPGRGAGRACPSSTTKAKPTKSRLLRRNAPSRPSGESMPPGDRSRSPRQAMRPKPTTTTTRKKPMSSGPSVDSEKAWTDWIDAGPGEERAEDRQGERGDRQRQVPDPQQAAALLDEHRVEVRRPAQPRQERGVLDRVPSPEAAPAEHLVRPPRAEDDADRQERPRQQRPPSGLDLPPLADPAGGQHPDGEGERAR